jgi:hypothetical protein
MRDSSIMVQTCPKYSMTSVGIQGDLVCLTRASPAHAAQRTARMQAHTLSAADASSLTASVTLTATPSKPCSRHCARRYCPLALSCTCTRRVSLVSCHVTHFCFFYLAVTRVHSACMAARLRVYTAHAWQLGCACTQRMHGSSVARAGSDTALHDAARGLFAHGPDWDGACYSRQK